VSITEVELVEYSESSSNSLYRNCDIQSSKDAEGYLCHCRQIHKNVVCSAIKNSFCNSVEKIELETGAGSGCGACKARIDKLIHKEEGYDGANFSYCDRCRSIKTLCICLNANTDKA
jgi:NAD(P)H-nitrite reductase large subunit